MTPSVDILIHQAQLAEREGRRDDARSLFERALRSLRTDEDRALASALLRWVACTYQADADLDAAMDCLDAALAAGEQAGDSGAVGHALNVQASIHQQRGELDGAESLYLAARTSAIDAGDTRLAATTALNLGLISVVRGDHDKTLRYYRTSLAEFRTLGAPKEVLAALNTMGMLCTELERWEEATRSFDEAALIADALGDFPARVLVEVNRAELEIARGDFLAARGACELARTLSAQTADSVASGEIEKHFGTVARELGELTLAEEHFERAQRLAVERKDLLLAAETAREHAVLCRKQGRHRDALMHLNRGHRIFAQLSARRELADVDRRNAQLERLFLDVVRTWSTSIESKDRHTQGHCERVADLACALGLRVGVAPRDLFWFRVGATVHDVGKLIIPSEVLNKPGKLSADEWELVKRHPIAGVDMLADMDFPADVSPMVRSHHERWDGTGYPEGLVGDEIPRAARMLCIADVYDALISKRGYKGALSHDEAMTIMREDVGRTFDPELFAHFEDLMTTRAPSLRQRAAVEAPPSDRKALRDLSVSGPSDDLTGLLARRPFVDTATKILAERGPFATVSLIVIDVDDFKLVNDTHGHLQGDAVLRVVAGTLREMAASVGIIGRYAGDEFVILLPHTAANEAAEIAERIRSTVRRASVPLRERSGSVSVTLSIGVAGARREHTDFESLFEAADRALYEAKRRSRDAVVLAGESEDAAQEPPIHLKQFVGRDRELQRLMRALDAAVAGRPQLVSVVGEAGIGKSALVRQLADEVRGRAGFMIAGASSEADAKPPCAPWAEVVGAIHDLGIVERGRGWRELPQLVPAIDPAPHAATGSKYALYDEIVAYLRAAAVSYPLVVLLDDMQWADAATWDVLEHVMSQIQNERLLICVTMRTEDCRGEALTRRNRILRDERFHEVPLLRLGDGEFAQWLYAVFGGQSSPELLAYLQRYSEGNPLLATQLVRTLLDGAAIRYEHGWWVLRAEGDARPAPAITGLMDRRLDRLTPATRTVLNTAAVIGRTFDVDLAIAAGAGDEDAVLDALDEGIAHAVVAADPDTGGNRFSFTHALLVDGVRRGINPRRLARIHERVAEAMEARRSSNAAEIALHYDRAGNPAKAFGHALTAGGAALAMYAHADARTFFEIAERAAADAEQRAVALSRLAGVAETEGRYALTEELCDRALAGLAGRRDDHTTLGLRRMRERVRALQGQPANVTIDVCRDLLAIARAIADRAEEAALLNMISQYQGRLGEWRDAEDVARAAVEAAEATNDGRLLAEALTRLGTSVVDRHTSDAAEYYQRALRLFRSVGDRCGEARCNINIGIIHQRAGEVPAAEAAYDLALQAARSAHAVDLAGLASLNLGVLYLRRGQRELASERFDEALARFTESSNEAHRLATLYNLAHLARESEDWRTASALYDQVMSVAGRIGQPDVELGARAGQALASLAVGSRSVAEDAMRWIRAHVEPRPEWWFQGRDMVDSLRIRLAAERGDDAHALRLLHEAVEIAGLHDPYVSAYLVAECGPSLRRMPESMLTLIDRVSPDVEALGFDGISKRLVALRLTFAGAMAAA